MTRDSFNNSCFVIDTRVRYVVMLSVRLLRVPYTRRSHLSAAQTLDEVVCEGLVARIKLKNTSAIRIYDARTSAF